MNLERFCTVAYCRCSEISDISRHYLEAPPPPFYLVLVISVLERCGAFNLSVKVNGECFEAGRVKYNPSMYVREVCIQSASVDCSQKLFSGKC